MQMPYKAVGYDGCTMKILVLDEFAPLYQDYLHSLPHAVSYRTSTDEAERDAENAYDILLAQPDLAAEYLQRGGKVDWIQSTWAGVRPLIETNAENVRISGVKDVFGQQIAEYVFTYLLEEIRYPDRYRSNQARYSWQQILPGTLQDRAIAIIGFGSIGQQIAQTAQAFGMRVTGVSASGASVSGFDNVVAVTNLTTAVADVEYVVAVLPDTPATEGILNEHIFDAMKMKPLFINVGRGNTVDEAALLKSVRDGSLRGAVLDVFTQEPLPPEHPFWQEPGITVTPHVAAVSHPKDIAAVFIENLERYLNGEPLAHELDQARGY